MRLFYLRYRVGKMARYLALGYPLKVAHSAFYKALTLNIALFLALAGLIYPIKGFTQTQLLPPRGQFCIIDPPTADNYLHTIICGYADGEGEVWTHRKSVSFEQLRIARTHLRPAFVNEAVSKPFSFDWLMVGWVPSDKCIDGPRVWPQVRYVPGCIP